MVGARIPAYLEPLFKPSYDDDVCKECEFELNDEIEDDREFKQ